MTATSENQTATDHIDLFEDLYTFLTSHVDLTTANEEWISEEYVAGQHFILRGQGLAQGDSIYIGVRLYINVGADTYNLEIRGYTGYQNGLPFDQHPGSSPPVYLCSHSAAQTYWFVANGRRFMIMNKISTNYFSAYVGFFLPYATPSQYPYPMLVSASTHIETGRWGDPDNISHAGYVYENGVLSNGYYRTPGGVWKHGHGRNSNRSSNNNPTDAFTIVPWYGGNGETFRQEVRDNIDGDYSVFPGIVHNPDDPSLEGELDGYGWISGFGGIVPESTVSISGDTWIVGQDVFASAVEDFFAVKLV